MYEQQSEEERPRESLFTKQKLHPLLSCWQVVDVFAFIPVPKDETVSTKQSLIGTAIFFLLVGTYFIFDFVRFIVDNPPVQQVSREALDQEVYELPRIALAFMEGELSNQTAYYPGLFDYEWESISKEQGQEIKRDIPWKYVTYQAPGNQTNFDLLPWVSPSTKQFYYILRTPVQPLRAQGLLYSSDITTYARVKISFCSNRPDCLDNGTMTFKSNYGRFFLFVESQRDDSPLSRSEGNQNGNNFRLFNFFAVANYYKRININFQVVKTTTLPDYFLRFTQKNSQRLQIESVEEQISVANFNNTNKDAISLSFKLSDEMLNNRVSCQTLLDRLSLWGAFWGVVFAVFAMLFLRYNREKFYRRNPDWDRFKQTLQAKRAPTEM